MPIASNNTKKIIVAWRVSSRLNILFFILTSAIKFTPFIELTIYYADTTDQALFTFMLNLSEFDCPRSISERHVFINVPHTSPDSTIPTDTAHFHK